MDTNISVSCRKSLTSTNTKSLNTQLHIIMIVIIMI